MDTSSLHELLIRWKQARPRHLEAAACLKDILALIEKARPNVKGLVIPGTDAALPLTSCASNLFAFLKHEALPLVQESVRTTFEVNSPYAGAVLLEHARVASAGGSVRFSTPSVVVATFNPGRTGLAALGSNEVLYWRL